MVPITTAPKALSDDLAQRTRRYLIQMGIRTACFLGAVLVQHWTRWLLLAAAVVLPYLAVVSANAGRERGTTPGTLVDQRALPGRAAPPADEGRPL